MITKEQSNAIYRMARELEDTGRLTSLSEHETSRKEWQDKNRNIQCALQDYLAALVEAGAKSTVGEPVLVYLVATGEVYEGQETYTRHDVLPPLCEAELLYTTPPAEKREALTDKQILSLKQQHLFIEQDGMGGDCTLIGAYDFARATDAEVKAAISVVLPYVWP